MLSPTTARSSSTEFNLTILSRTPLIDLITTFKGAGQESPFMKGAVHDFTNKLASVSEHGEPFFRFTLIFWRPIRRSVSSATARSELSRRISSNGTRRICRLSPIN